VQFKDWIGFWYEKCYHAIMCVRAMDANTMRCVGSKPIETTETAMSKP
jgi:hypothetical protein